jgi:hypothetical protein
MRRCRNPQCGAVFTPVKDFYVYCCWPCHVAHVGEDHARHHRGYQRSQDQCYDRGFWDGARVRPPMIDIPPCLWKGMLLLVHPDKWQCEPGLLTLATEVTRWLLAHRPAHRS